MAWFTTNTDLDKKLDLVLLRQQYTLSLLYEIRLKDTIMVTDLANITVAVAKAQTVGDSVLLLLAGLAAKIADLSAQLAAALAAADPAAQAAVQAQLDGLAASLSTEQDAVAAAVTANTPV